MKILNTFGSVSSSESENGFDLSSGYRVSNTNSNSKQKSVVRVYNAENKLIAEQFINKRNPLGYIKSHDGRHRKELREQCIAGGMPASVFEDIFCSSSDQ